MYRVGGRLPLHATGVGRVLLAFAPPALQEEVLSHPLQIQPEGITLSPRDLRTQLAAVRWQGTTTMSRALPEPMTSVAAPIRESTGQVIAAMSVVSSTAKRATSCRPALVAVALAVSRALARSGTRVDQDSALR